jgi:hypothetical protein
VVLVVADRYPRRAAHKGFVELAVVHLAGAYPYVLDCPCIVPVVGEGIACGMVSPDIDGKGVTFLVPVEGAFVYRARKYFRNFHVSLRFSGLIQSITAHGFAVKQLSGRL